MQTSSLFQNHHQDKSSTATWLQQKEIWEPCSHNWGKTYACALPFSLIELKNCLTCTEDTSRESLPPMPSTFSRLPWHQTKRMTRKGRGWSILSSQIVTGEGHTSRHQWGLCEKSTARPRCLSKLTIDLPDCARILICKVLDSQCHVLFAMTCDDHSEAGHVVISVMSHKSYSLVDVALQISSYTASRKSLHCWRLVGKTLWNM